ncbi:type I-E CRISPR-associated protein Cse1/CasA [Lactiplantibacillus argentoratensis]|jgi:CRISPR system Cascade subunit CasA|uniref:type I-E CRISPR-associated protein Cse1/CasA n=2 Tax=Lactiplantibacillus argentoratensis TaxID=271881 RepID=UPI00128BD534|nr:type I-E CRISPR-associated protein Cse1/CasA [Lactiplantibacillus argentoratensis]MPQ36817.1 type I-E CRISPR-associated protein Cse1/CasA [Lactiplantibacillus plantarum]MZU91428.1 CRISPR-associated protein [Lactiplantibacillus plantarum]
MKTVRMQTFNLTTDPWIVVIDARTNQAVTVSLIELFQNAQYYRRLAGDMRAQDLAILRLLLAILTTIYTRYGADNQAYEWLTMNDMFEVEHVDEDYGIDEIHDDLKQTWADLFASGHFSTIVTDYLQCHAGQFDLFGDQPFYQVTASAYDEFVPEAKSVARSKRTGKPTGQVAVRQMNRRISESGNSVALFAPKVDETKNELTLAELVRWLIMYQNYTGVTDKTKINSDEKFSNGAGWLYRLNPVYASGRSLFEILMLNLVLVPTVSDEQYIVQQPVWEYATLTAYLQERQRQQVPDNLAALYTTWSRLLHLEWDDHQRPTIYSAGIPMFDTEDALIEPMTLWRQDKKTSRFRPAVNGIKYMGKAMWRNFGQYVNVNRSDDIYEAGIVAWLHYLKTEGLVADDRQLWLASTALISDGNMSSQMPATEVYDDMQIQADVLFDEATADHWPVRIEEVIELTQRIGDGYYHFAATVGQIRNIDAKQFAQRHSAQFYASLNRPFKDWLASLTGNDDRDAKIKEWRQTLQQLTLQASSVMMATSSSRDVRGIVERDKNNVPRQVNIFTANDQFRRLVFTQLSGR